MRTLRHAVRPIGVLLLALPAAGCGWSAARPDSVLLVTLDTLRADHLSCYGKSPVATPNIDQVARAGALAERAWTPTPLTTPAHSSILTGLYPPAHGVRNNARFRLPEDVTTLAEVLKGRGLRTAAFVGSFTTSASFGLAQGFDTFDDVMGNKANGQPRSERPGNEVADRAIEWLRSNASSPFFLWVHFYDAHSPYEPPPPFAKKHAGDPYSGEVAFVDLQVGRVLEALQKSGAAKRTVLVVVGDHGEGLGGHGEAEHGCLLYEDTLQVPFLVAARGRIPSGKRIHGPVSLVDVEPTVLALLGIPPPPGLQGIDVLAKDPPKERGIYAETLYPFEEFGWSALYAYRKGDLKVIEAPRRELYDLASDPREERTLAGERRNEAQVLADELRGEADRIVDPARLAQAVGLGASGAVDPDNLQRLESLGYVGGGGNVAAGMAEARLQVGGRNPRDAMDDFARFAAARGLSGLGRNAESAAILTDLLRRDPGNPQFLLSLAHALASAGRDAEAETRYRELIKAHPDFYLAYRSYGDFLERRGRAIESRDLWLGLASRVPGYVGMEARIAQAEIAGGLARDAAKRLDAHLAQRPDDAAAWSMLGRARQDLHDAGGALEAYRKALALQPADAEAVRGACALLESSGRRAEAREMVQQLLARAPADPVLTQTLAGLAER